MNLRFNIASAIMAVGVSMMAQTITIDNVNYRVATDHAVVAESPNASGNVIVQNYVESDGVLYPVTIIGERAFADSYSRITTMVIPNNVTTIEKHAFIHCESMTTLVLGSKVQSLGEGCLGFTQRLESIMCLNTTPPYISKDVWWQCGAKSIYVPQNALTYYSENSGWQKFKKHLVPLDNNSIASIESTFKMNYRPVIKMPANETPVITQAPAYKPTPKPEPATEETPVVKIKYVPATPEEIRKALTASDLDPKVLIPSQEEIAELMEKATNGDAEAAYRLGNYYCAGMGVTYNIDKALKWYTKASDAGYAPATVELGRLYYNGQGVTKNYTKAFTLWSSVASKNLHAKYLMATCYEDGEGTVKNLPKAKALYKELVDPLEMAAMKGDPTAQAILYDMYYYGQGVTKNIQEAISWAEKGALGGSARAASAMCYAYATGEGVTKSSSKEKQYGLLAATLGNTVAMYNLGLWYDNNYNHASAFEWYLKAAERGFSDAQDKVAYAYSEGEGVAKNTDLAFEWAKKSAAQGNQYGERRLGYYYRCGIGVAQNYVEAMKWYKKSAAQGNDDAMLGIGYMYEMGLGVPKNKQTAIIWYKKSAAKGNETAQQNLRILKIYSW